MPSDDAKKWMKDHGVETDVDGFPVPVSHAGPPKPCLRCGVMCECPNEVCGQVGGVVREGAICGDCTRLMHADPRAFWDGFK